MATGEKITVNHGSKKFEVQLGIGGTLEDMKLKDLSEAIYAASGIPIIKQKLICKGKTISKDDPDKSLASMGINGRSKIMLIGKKVDEEEKKAIQTISNYDSQSEKLHKKLKEIKKDIDGLEKGYLPKEQVDEAVTKLSKKVKMNSECFMKIIESLDSLELHSDFSEARAKRKNVINQINNYLTENDKEEDRVNEIKSKL